MSRPVEILQIEDNPADIDLMRECFSESKLAVQVHACTNGEEGLDFLLRRGPHTNAPRPDLVLLDLNLPRRDGREVLAEIKQAPTLRRIPVIVLTSSPDRHDVNKAYELGANSYIKKPWSFGDYETIVSAIEHYWFTLAMLPSAD